MLKDIVSNEIVVAGVYLRLFVSNPAWTLRKPKQFLADLLDFVVEQISKSSSEVSFFFNFLTKCCSVILFNFYFFFVKFAEGRFRIINNRFSGASTLATEFS